MATNMLESSAISAFCESLATMYSAGIQIDEAVHLLGEDLEDSSFKSVCDRVYAGLISGEPLAKAIEESGAFPSHVIDMVAAGESAGHLENVLWSLAKYYDENDRLFAKIRNAITYPAALLTVMSLILLFTVTTILPVFIGVYRDLAGTLTAGSLVYVNAAIIIGWIALGITVICALSVLIAILVGRTPRGQLALVHLLEKLPFTRGPLEQMALGRFMAVLATFVAAGIDTNTSMKRSVAMVDHVTLHQRLGKAYDDMIDPTLARSLAQAIAANNVLEPVYARMLTVGTRAGNLESVLDSLSDTFFNDSIARIDGLIDSVEPTLAAFLTVSVGATLIAVMLPLVGIMGSIG